MKKTGTHAKPESSLAGVRRMAREDRRYSAEVFALRHYVNAFERLLPVALPAIAKNTRPVPDKRKQSGKAVEKCR